MQYTGVSVGGILATVLHECVVPRFEARERDLLSTALNQCSAHVILFNLNC